jgi:hypothetical protein
MQKPSNTSNYGPGFLLRIPSASSRGISCGISCVISLAAALFAGSVQAHQIWLEQDGKNAALYFGEFRSNLHEVSPGILDKLSQPTARLLTSNGVSPVALEKKKNDYSVAALPQKGQSLIVEDLDYPVREAHGELGLSGKMLWRPAARFVPDLGARDAKLMLDIVPTGAANTFSVVWNGAPVPGAKIEVIAMSGWSREFTADEKGSVHAPLPWRGRYVLLTHHTEKTPGEQDGKPYDFITYTSTLSFELHKGEKSPLVPALAAPNG